MMHTWKAWPQLATAAMACALICTVVATGAEAASFQPLGDLPGGAFESMALDVTPDGSVAVGYSSGEQSEAVRWSASGGLVGLGILPNGHHSRAEAVSHDGAVVVGYGSAAGAERPFRWNAEEGMVELPRLSAHSEGNAFDVSADGNVVVGTCNSSSQPIQAFRWTPGSGMVALAGLTGGSQNEAYAVSANGSLAGGISDASAVVWDEAGTIRKVQDILLDDYGVELPGWNLYAVTSLSADGQIMAGYGNNPDGRLEGWIARIPEPNGLLLLVFGLTLMAGWRPRN